MQPLSYYNIMADPYQLRNAVHDLDYGVLQQLHKILNRLRACKGRECNIRNRPVETSAKNRRPAANSQSSSSSSSSLDLEPGDSFPPSASNPKAAMKRESANFSGFGRRKGETVVRVDLSKTRNNVNNFQHRNAPLPGLNSSSFYQPSVSISRIKKNIIE